MSGLIYQIKNLVGLGSADGKANEENPPKSMRDVIERLPESFHRYMQEELPYRRAAAFVFIGIVLGMGTPLWYHTTRTYRADFATFPEEQTVSLSIQIRFVVTNNSLIEEMNDIAGAVLNRIRESQVKEPLNILWNVINQGVRDLHSLESEHITKSDSLEVFVALVSPEQWPHFSATAVFLGRGRWAFVQYTLDRDKLEERINNLIWEVLIDVPHLNSIVKRDLRERIQPWQIAALSPSHQKRLVWDSAPISMNYILQVVHVHDNGSPLDSSSDGIMKTMEVFARRLQNVTLLKISSEHLWDFDVSNFFEVDVQGRLTLSQQEAERLLKEVDSQLQFVESSFPVLKILIIEREEPVVMLDSFGEDSRGAAIAAWGAIVPRICLGETPEDAQPAARALAALRILLGVDSELPASWQRAPIPLAEWEIERMRLRAVLDNAMRAMSAVSALKALIEKITNVVIGDDVAERANNAVKLVTEGLTNPEAPQLDKISTGRKMADEALSHPSLLAMLYFPKDQTMAVYLPIMLPTLIPMFSSVIALCKWTLGWS